MATKAEVRDRAGNDLGLLRLNQGLQSQDSTRITSAYEEIYAQLKKEGLATWASDGEVPDEITPHMVALVAENCLGTYSVSPERYQRIKNESSVAKREIRKYTAPAYVSQDEPANF